MACQNNAHDFPSSSSGNTIRINLHIYLHWIGNWENWEVLLYTVHLYTSGGDGKGEAFPLNPGTIAKDGEQPKPQPAIRIDSSRKL